MATGYPGQQQQFQQQPQPGYGGYPQQQQPQFGGGIQSQFVSTFMPSQSIQPTPYMDPSQMQFQQQQQGAPSLQQSFAQSNQQQTGQSTVPIPWALTADEKKRYDQIFRAWDPQGTGFIAGSLSKEVFGQAGLERDDLMDIW
jgi:hypothetical protein